MRLLLSTIVAFAIGFCVVACTKDEVCDKAKSASVLIAGALADQLSCKNAAAIQQDLEAALVKVNICKPPAEVGTSALGPIGDVICKPVVDALVAGLVTQIPAKYECSGDGKITDDIKAKLVAVCLKAI